MLPTALYRRPRPARDPKAAREHPHLYDPDLTVVEDAPTIEICMPEVPACRALVPYRHRPGPARTRPPFDHRPRTDTDLTGFFSECRTRELEPPTRADRSRSPSGALDEFLEKRLWFAFHSLTVLVVGITVGLLLGTVGR